MRPLPFLGKANMLHGTNIDNAWSTSFHFKRVPTKIIHMETTNDDNETSIMNVDANMDDLKDYVGTSDILES
jgi:hypothetical protein